MLNINFTLCLQNDSFTNSISEFSGDIFKKGIYGLGTDFRNEMGDSLTNLSGIRSTT